MKTKRNNVYNRTNKYTYDYNIDIQDERWINKSLFLRENAKHTCEICGAKGKTVVHHSYYLDGLHLWEYPKDALKVLCIECHKTEHDIDINPCDKVVEAINNGITKGAIIDCLDNLIYDNGIHIPKNAIIPTKKGVNKVNIPPKNLLDTFLYELNQYTKEYNEDYISSFIEYYKQKNNTGHFLFEPLDQFSYKEKLQEWSNLKEFLFFENISKEVELHAKESWHKYFYKVQNIIAASLERNREYLNECYYLLAKEYSENTDLNEVCMRDIIPNFQNKKSTLKAYIDKRGLPNVYLELYRNSVLNEIEAINPKGSKNIHIWKEKRYIDSNALIDIERIKTIENNIDIKLFWQPYFYRDIHYCLDYVSYVKRFVLKKLIEYNGGLKYFIEHWLPKFKSVNPYNNLSFNEPSISFDDFKFVYILNAMLRNNSANIICHIKTMDPNILLNDFCKENRIKVFNPRTGLTLKSYLEEKIKSFDAETSFQPIIIEVEDTSLNFYNQDIDIPQELQKALNEKLNFCFIMFKLNTLHKEHKFTRVIGIANNYYISNNIFFQVKWTPSFDILTTMDGDDFDFSCERFIKTKMKSVSKPTNEELSTDLYNKLSLLERKIIQKEHTEVEEWKTNYEEKKRCKLREL